MGELLPNCNAVQEILLLLWIWTNTVQTCLCLHTERKEIFQPLKGFLKLNMFLFRPNDKVLSLSYFNEIFIFSRWKMCDSRYWDSSCPRFIYAARDVWRTLIDASRCRVPWKTEIFIKTWNQGGGTCCRPRVYTRWSREREKERARVRVRWCCCMLAWLQSVSSSLKQTQLWFCGWILVLNWSRTLDFHFLIVPLSL